MAASNKNIEVGEFLDELVLTTTGSHCWKYMMKIVGEAIDADITFKAAGGEVVKAHRLVLKLSSPVFNVMLGSDLKPHPKFVVGLKDVDVEVFRLFLIVMYSGAECEKVLKDDVVKKHLKELIDVCSTYEVTHVYPILSNLVKHVLTIENSCGYLGSFTKYDIDNSCATYISIYITKHFPQVAATPGFMWLAHFHPTLVVRLVTMDIHRRKCYP